MTTYHRLLDNKRELEDRLLAAKVAFDAALDWRANLDVRQTKWRAFLQSARVISLCGLLKDTEEQLERAA